MDIIEMLKISILIITSATIPSFLVATPFYIFVKRKEVWIFLKKERELEIKKYVTIGIVIGNIILILSTLLFQIYKTVSDLIYTIGLQFGIEVGKKFFNNNHEIFVGFAWTISINMSMLIITILTVVCIYDFKDIKKFFGYK